jgi:PKD repeat protein
MKIIMLLFYFLFISLLLFPYQVKTQSTNMASRKSTSGKCQQLPLNYNIGSSQRQANLLLTRRNFNNHNIIKILGNIDTLNYPLPGTRTYYISDGGGYVTGNNEYGDLAKANYFEMNQPCILTGILFDFVHAIGGNPEIQIVVWDNTGQNNSPGSIKATSFVSLETIKTDITNNQKTYIPFVPPVFLTTSFYAGIVLPTAEGDTLALWSNTDGDTNPGIAWEKWKSGTWYPMRSNLTWSLDIAMAIFPVVDDEVPLTADFSANLTNIQIGQSVNFQDLSIGSPEAWEWIFEGGDPAISTVQNPQVTYQEDGIFDVTLVVWKNEESSTKIANEYIHVSGTLIEIIDTLNYPLAGEYGIYNTPAKGYVTGNNEYGDLAKANFFQNNQNLSITGVLMEFAYATGGNPNIEIALWNNSGTNGSPGIKIGSVNVLLNAIKNHISNNQLTYVAFNPPINVVSSFYAGFMLPTSPGDTLVIWSNTDGDTNPTTAWELWDSNQWYSFTHPDSWGLKIALAVFPIVQKFLAIDESNIKDMIEVFPNPSNGLYSIVSELFTNRSVSLTISKTDGTIIRNATQRNKESILINLTNELSGIYFLRINLDSEIFFQKLIKH